MKYFQREHEMSDENSEKLNLVDEMPEPTPLDSIAELKAGIYNLFIGLYNTLIIEYGLEEAVKQSTAFLDDISYNFKNILTNEKESNPL